MNRLEQLKKKAVDHGVLILANKLLEKQEFELWTASLDNKHHYGRGGLVLHTHEVVTLCERNAEWFINQGHTIDQKKLFLAALFHDAGKLWDYRPVAGTVYKEWEGETHKREIHHITRSALFWQQCVDQTGSCLYLCDDVLHIILSHHGQRAWGSPVAPHTKEAWILHVCDQMSARVDDCDRFDVLNYRHKEKS